MITNQYPQRVSLQDRMLVFCRVVLMTVVAGVILSGSAGTLAFAADSFRIEPEFRIGDRFHYTWHLENELSWSPAVKGTDWVTMSTDFDFFLDAKYLHDDGGCLFGLDGKNLQSVAESAKGKLGLRASPSEASLLFGKNWTKPGPNTPLAKPMTVTMGNRFQVTSSTGLEAIALFFLPGVDPRVWFVMTTAPQGDLSVGDAWAHDFDVAIPGAEGEPLHVVVSVEVAAVEMLKDAPVLTIRATGELNLADTDVRMKDGQNLHILHGRYEASAVAKWDIQRGFLRFAEVEQSLRATTDEPETHRLASQAVSRLVLEDLN